MHQLQANESLRLSRLLENITAVDSIGLTTLSNSVALPVIDNTSIDQPGLPLDFSALFAAAILCHGGSCFGAL